MAKLRNKHTGEFIGNIASSQLQFLIDELEEESKDDKDYWINRTQVAMFKEKGADPGLIAILEYALGYGDEVEIAWE